MKANTHQFRTTCAAAAGTTTIGVRFDNSGTVAAQSGTLQLNGGGTLGGQARTNFGRWNATGPATQTLGRNGSTPRWLRGGTSPEVYRTTFEHSVNGQTWTSLGAGSRIAGGWQLNVASLPANGTVRARGYVTGQVRAGRFVESTLALGQTSGSSILVNDGSFGFRTNRFGFNVSGTSGQTVVVEGSTNLLNWLPLRTNTLGSGPFYFNDPSGTGSRRFYRVRGT
jgi:hypothetical protein